VLEEIIREYDIDKLQVNDFNPQTKNVLLSVLAFERLLLENSTNRKLFNSYDVSVVVVRSSHTTDPSYRD
jgi:E3 ubiquitin-protein ligase HUWE1